MSYFTIGGISIDWTTILIFLGICVAILAAWNIYRSIR